MSTNLLELLNAHLTEEIVSKIANFIGDSPKNTGTALGSALPSLLSGLIHKTADPQGASILFNLLTQNHDTGLLSNLGASLGSGDMTAKLASTGSNLLNSIFGNKSENIASAVASTAGINKTASSSLLSLVMPIIFAVLGKTIKSQQITSPAGLVNLLGGQAGFLKNLIPAGLESLFGASVINLGSASNTANITQTTNLSNTASTTTTRAVEPETKSKVETPAPSLVKERKIDPPPRIEPAPSPVLRDRKMVPPPPVADDDDDAGIFGKLLPWLILGSILALGWGIWKNLKKTVNTEPVAASSSTVPADTSTIPATPEPTPAPVTATTEPATPPPDTTPPPATPEPVAAPAPASENPSGGFLQKLSSGFELKAPADSMESKLYAFITDANAQIDKDKWFTMDGITFDTGKATLRPESVGQITNIIEIMKAFPNVKIKIGGYTDNTGKPKSNQKLSADRANTIQAELIKAGIDSGRLNAEGYGSEHPVASNATAEGRQQNRRIDVRVTEK